MVPKPELNEVLDRERCYHEQLYSGKAQELFAKPAVRALRRHMVRRILQITGADKSTRVLSIGCGIGDTELILAQHVAGVTGIDLSPKAIAQANADAARQGITNARFHVCTLEDAPFEQTSFDVIIAIFFLHHLPPPLRESLPAQVSRFLRPEGCFYALDPNRYRLSGAVGRFLIPKVMSNYQSPDEEQLVPRHTAALFEHAGFACRTGYYDFLSTPLAGLFPKWTMGYHCSRMMDDVVGRIPGLRAVGSNFELVATRPKYQKQPENQSTIDHPSVLPLF